MRKSAISWDIYPYFRFRQLQSDSARSRQLPILLPSRIRPPMKPSMRAGGLFIEARVGFLRNNAISSALYPFYRYSQLPPAPASYILLASFPHETIHEGRGNYLLSHGCDFLRKNAITSAIYPFCATVSSRQLLHLTSFSHSFPRESIHLRWGDIY